MLPLGGLLFCVRALFQRARQWARFRQSKQRYRAGIRANINLRK